jgi:hypothetical protein
LDVLTPFPKFGKSIAPTPSWCNGKWQFIDEVTAALLEATGGVIYTMPIGPTCPGTMEYVQSRRRRC